MTDAQDISAGARYYIFESLSHPTRVSILRLVAQKDMGFSSLKSELGIDSSGHLQHHLQKLEGLVEMKTDTGSYALTSLGRRALDLYAVSERSGAPLASVCCLPTAMEVAREYRVGRIGTVLRLVLGGILLTLAGAVALSFFSGHWEMSLVGPPYSIGLDPITGVVAGFFGVSFLIAGARGDPGCEVTAIPNLFSSSKKYYCSCLMSPFNIPNGRLLESVPASRVAVQAGAAK